MKKILVFTIVLFSVSANAQHNEVQRAIEKDMERKYSGEREKGTKAIDESLDKWDEADKKVRANIEPFPTMSMTIDMQFPERPKNDMQIDYYFKQYECATVMHLQKENSGIDRTIMNFKEGKSIMLMTDKKGRKSGMQMELKTFDWAIRYGVNKSDKMLEDGDATFVETNEYKTIEGYKCRKYLYEDMNSKSEIWITQEMPIDYVQYNRAFYSAFSSGKQAQQNSMYKSGKYGAMIQMHSYPKNGRTDESIITIKNIKPKHAPEEMFSTAGYDITQMPSIRDMWNDAKNQR